MVFQVVSSFSEGFLHTKSCHRFFWNNLVLEIWRL